MNFNYGGVSDVERILYELMKQPFISAAIFLIVGFFAPLVEEVFNPMAIWFLLKRPLVEHEGFTLGLISGGAFAILESAGMVIQIDIHDWLIAILLRAATGVLHIGLSGLVGYGLVRSWNRKQSGRGILYTLSATILHGAWNSLALLSGLSSSAISEGSEVEISDITSIISLLFMIIVFITIVVITIKINLRLKQDLADKLELSS
jgi:RsiW-degrading membrane proteinase PrsW (M82 family)